MCLYLSGGVEADVKLLRAADKVWPEEIRCGRKFVEDQGKNEEMTSCPQCNCANIKRLSSVADSMDSGPFAICNLSLRLGGRVALKGKLRFPGLNFDSRVGFVVVFFFFKVLRHHVSFWTSWQHSMFDFDNICGRLLSTFKRPACDMCCGTMCIGRKLQDSHLSGRGVCNQNRIAGYKSWLYLVTSMRGVIWSCAAALCPVPQKNPSLDWFFSTGVEQRPSMAQRVKWDWGWGGKIKMLRPAAVSKMWFVSLRATIHPWCSASKTLPVA